MILTVGRSANLMDDRPGALPSCSIVIPTRARARLLQHALASLASQTGAVFEVVVVCDGEDADTRKLAADFVAPFPIHWVFLPERSGQAAARNIGAGVAHNAILLFMDDDTVARPTWVVQHCRRHVTAGGSMAVCGKTVDVYAGPPTSHTERFLRDQRREACAQVEATWSRGNRSSCAADNFWHCFGVNCSIGRPTFLRLGGFDPQLDVVSEEMELGSRMAAMEVEFAFEAAAWLEHHDTKVLSEYIPRSWEAGARADLYRVRVKKQCNAQTAGLCMVESLSALRRARVLVSWCAPALVARIANLFRAATEASGSRVCFRLWSGLSMSAIYWGEVRKQGYTITGLRKLVADARRSSTLGLEPPASPQVSMKGTLRNETPEASNS